MVRFSASFDEEDGNDEDDPRRGSGSLSKPPLAPSGGSVSLAAQHFCPICGIIATSQDNLEVCPAPTQRCPIAHFALKSQGIRCWMRNFDEDCLVL